MFQNICFHSIRFNTIIIYMQATNDRTPWGALSPRQVRGGHFFIRTFEAHCTTANAATRHSFVASIRTYCYKTTRRVRDFCPVRANVPRLRRPLHVYSKRVQLLMTWPNLKFETIILWNNNPALDPCRGLCPLSCREVCLQADEIINWLDFPRDFALSSISVSEFMKRSENLINILTFTLIIIIILFLLHRNFSTITIRKVTFLGKLINKVIWLQLN